MRQFDSRGRSSRRRSGFTLVELMVVITIIVALLALTASAVMKALVVQQTSTTQTTLNTLQSQLKKAWESTKDQAMKEQIPSTADSFIRQYLVGATNDPYVDKRVRVIYIKLRMRQVFPQNFAEALNVSYNNPQLAQLSIATTVPTSPLPALPVYTAYLNKLGVTANYVGSQTQPQSYESSACLFMALQRAQSGGGASQGDIGGGGTSIGFDLTASGAPGQSIPVFIDAWQQPLYFTRVPAGCGLVNQNPKVPGGGTQGRHDPGDPDGMLNSNAWLMPTPQSATTPFTQLTLQPLAAGNCSYNLVPLIASSGQNRKLEVDPIWFSGTYNDDLFSTGTP